MNQKFFFPDLKQVKIYSRSQRLFLLLLLLLGYSLQSSATSLTLQHDYNDKGYSVEKVPNVDEYIAAGTNYIDVPPDPVQKPTDVGIHFMHLDANGNIITSSTLHPNYNWIYEARVVDIVPINQQECFVIVHMRQKSVIAPAFNKLDFIQVLRVDIATGLLCTHATNQFDITSQNNENVYPVHSLYLDNNLYICGYVTNNPQDFNFPTRTSLDKRSIVLTFDVTKGLYTMVQQEINTTNGPDFDYDMALKMQTTWNDVNLEEEILVVGAANAYTPPTYYTQRSAVMVAHFDKSLNVIKMNVIDLNLSANIAPVVTDPNNPPPPSPEGVYAIDIYDDQDPNRGMYVLINDMGNNSSGTLDVIRWGILAIDDNLQARTSTSPAHADVMFYNNVYIDWAKQFYFRQGTDKKEVAVIGERKDMPGTGNCIISPTGITLPSASNNVNPFITRFDMDFSDPNDAGRPMWNLVSDITAQSFFGTQGTNVDYLTPSSFTWAYSSEIEEVTRLHTFATINNQKIITITPMGNDNNPTSPFLNAKFLELDFDGNEPDCQWQYENLCAGTFYKVPFENKPPGYYPASLDQTGTIEMDAHVITYTQSPCSWGKFKSTGVTSVQSNSSINIYPNPASNKINIDLPQSAGSDFSFVLTDATGKTIFQNTDNQSGKTQITLNLPNISTGIYFATISSKGLKTVQKLVIK